MAETSSVDENDVKDGDTRVRIDAPVDEVTLLEDRAHVRRRGTASLTEGQNKLVIEDVAPVLADKTISVTLVTGSERATLIDVRVRRKSVFDPIAEEDLGDEPSDRAKLAVDLAKLDTEIEKLLARKMLLESQAGGFDQLAGMSFAELAVDVAWGKRIGDDWGARIDHLRSSERALRERLVELSGSYDKLAREREDVRKRIESLDNAATRAWAAIELELSATGPGEVTMTVEYIVPNALWRPYHTAHLTTTDGKSKVELGTAACVWQNTGEDWKDAQLAFSTERPSLGTEPPELSSDMLQVRRKSDKVEVETRDQIVQTTGLGADTSISHELPGIDDGGEAIHLRAPSRADVPSDGRPHRIELSSFEADAEVALVAIPELTANVLLKSVQTNKSERPLLAGPVDLIRDSGYVGRSSVLFVAPNERFELGWGPESELRLKRSTEASDDKSKILSSWIQRTERIRLRLSNIGPSKRTVELTERVPVSEIDKVKIEIGPTKPKASGPDRDGFLTWTIELRPFSHESVELEYTLKKHQDVVGI